MRKRILAGVLSLVMILALLPGSAAADGATITGSAEVSLQKPGNDVTTGLTMPYIDITNCDQYKDADGNISFKYCIKIKSSSFFDTHVAPFADVTSPYGGRWKSRQDAESFTATIPADIFSKYLTVDWSGAEEIYNTGPKAYEVLKCNAADGIVLQGKEGSNNVCSSETYSGVTVRVPVTLPKEKLAEVAAEGALNLNGTAVISNSQLGSDSDLSYSISHSITVEDPNNRTGNLVATGPGDVQPVFDGPSGTWVLDGSGPYTFSGTAKDFEGLKVSGNATITLNNATIKHTSDREESYAPAISIEAGSDAKLILSGTNTIEGGRGYAGIHVDPGATLTISGDGTLNATGGKGYTSKTLGNAAAGAGIGGNGIKYISRSIQDGSTASFGTIIIDSGTITAVGGNYVADNTGGGAGIGTGGNSTKDGNERAETVGKSIIINGGTINATGGRGWIGRYGNLTGGGAGIGSGGCTGGFYTQNSIVDITINGGTVTAQGMDDGAGIGGGANVDGGTISITDGNVTATGGYEIEYTGEQCDYFGGAGIGGGDNGSITSISITGGTVTAKAVGAAAGIGQGSRQGANGFPGEITIGGSANVTAEGGSDSKGSCGGAGIGGGRYGDSIEITIQGNATVDASGGTRAPGIGGGTYEKNTTITISEYTRIKNATGGLHAAGIGTAWKGGTATITIDGEAAEVTATGGKRAAGIGTGQEAERADITISGGVSITATGGEYAAGIGTGVSGGNTDIMISGNALVKAFGYQHGAAIGSAWKGGTASVKLEENAQVYAYGNGNANAIGNGNAAGEASLELDDTITLWAQSGHASYPALTDKIAYNSTDKYLVCNTDDAGKALGYLTRPDGAGKELGYTLAGEKLTIDGTEIAAAKPVNTVGNWATIYSKPVPLFTVNYELDGGNDNGAYGKQTVKQGEEVTLAAAPTKDGYTFTGWSDGTNTYQPGATLTVNGDITLTAQWRKNSSGGTTYYTLHYDSNGGTQYKDERHRRNTVVNLDKVPVREGYQFTGWYGDKDLTEQVTSVKMTGDKTVYAGWHKSTVPDMLNGEDHFAYVIGYGDGTVHPGADISRAEVATIFFRLLKPEIRDGNLTDASPFADVSQGMWCNKAIATMAKLGIVKGRTAETFDPAAPITRAEFAAICARFDTGMTQGSSNFTDLAGHWAKEEIERAVSLGWIMGYADGTFRPDNPITRAEAMTMINRVLCRIPEDGDDLLPGMKTWPDNQPGDWYYLAVQEATNSHEFQHKGEIHEHWTKLTADPDWTRYQD